MGVFAALALLTAAAAQETTPPAGVTVNVGERLGPIPDLALSGFNYGNSMLVVGSQEEFDRIRVESLRFPPGNQADEIDVAEPDLAALLLNLGLLGDPPVLMVANLFSGTPQQAADLARLAESMGVPILGWEIGNEPDLYAENRADPSWTPQRYCEEFRSFRQALLEVDPDYVFAGPAVSGARPSGEEYLREVLAECGDVIDILSWHIYPTDGTWSDEEALATSAQFSEESRRYREWAASPAANPLGHDRDIEFAVTEFGLSWRSPSFRHLEDMTATLWLADVLGQMTRERLDLSHYFTLQGMGGHGLIDRSGWLRPTYYLYRMLAGFTGEAVAVRAAEPLRAYGVRGDDGLRLLLVNFSDGAVETRLDLPEADRAAGPPLHLLTLSQPVLDESGEPASEPMQSEAPFFVPARGIVLVAPNADGT